MKLCILLIATLVAVVYGQVPSPNQPNPTGPVPGSPATGSLAGPLGSFAQQQQLQRMQQQQQQQQRQQQYFNPWSFYFYNQIDNPFLRYMMFSNQMGGGGGGSSGFNPLWFMLAN
ncbi:transcription factor kayak-like [Haliotis rufescens]|uniref:transcription factor kayak-like n=1 Tax=Haliotis rufescens TaxID=6454 RepID=UPI00201EF4E7|nr:transcription factor kayak-like [Haliotis rufescens]